MQQFPTSVKGLYKMLLNRLGARLDQGEASQQAHWLLEALFGLNRSDYLLDKPLQVTEQDMEKLEELLQRLDRHEPIQYVLGEAPFYGRMFHVRPGALIPRPETEELLHRIVERHRQSHGESYPENPQESPKESPQENYPESHRAIYPANHSKALKILDIGTGSGCLAVSLALELGGSRVFALDVSTEALQLARENAQRLQADVQFIQANILEKDIPAVSCLDILVSNPPYVLEREAQLMQANVLDWEPALALFVKNEDPLLFYRRITELAAEWLKPGGCLYFEINEAYGAEVADLLRQAGFQEVLIRQDMQGKDRMVEACWLGSPEIGMRE